MTPSALVSHTPLASPTPDSTTAPTAEPERQIQVKLIDAFPNLSPESFGSRPIYLTYPPGQTDLIAVLSQEGKIFILSNDRNTREVKTFLDISDRVNRRGFEEGLLGLAFDPKYSVNGFFYVYYTAASPRRSVLSRFTVTKDRNLADKASELVILEINQPFDGNKGGMVAFGSDGFLYLGVGDGGSGADPLQAGQHPRTGLGSILRIDVKSASKATPYTVPDDNLFATENAPDGTRGEVWAYGLRNPWRFSFDPITNKLWLGDVGLWGRQEINVVEKYGNYGWSIKEGTLCFRPPSQFDCDDLTNLVPPVVEYDYEVGCRVIGGYVYRGRQISQLIGRYVYADYCSGRIWGFSPDGDKNPNKNQELARTNFQITSFGEDAHKEIYMMATNGKIYRLEPDVTSKLPNTPIATVETSWPGPPRLQPELMFPNAEPGSLGTWPLFLTYPSDGTGRVVTLSKEGRIYILQNSVGTRSASTFLDLARKVYSDEAESGLLGLAFHPNYRDNDLFYVFYSAGPFLDVLSQFRVSKTDRNAADPSSELILMRIHKPFSYHHGGMLAFGPDGFLYIGIGDGGYELSAELDQANNSQNPRNLLGSIIRIDVDRKNGNLSYAIPSDNPFASGAGPKGALGEIWAYGFRNPWRFSFDRSTGELWVGDTGNNRREEIDLVQPGANYGWKLMEGSECLLPDGQHLSVRLDCDRRGLELPITDYGHDVGCAVIGGYVYRGKRIPSLQGYYLYSDYCSGRIWAIKYSGKVVMDHIMVADTQVSVSSFAEDEQGELYILGFSKFSICPSQDCSQGILANVFRLVETRPGLTAAPAVIRPTPNTPLNSSLPTPHLPSPARTAAHPLSFRSS